MYGLELGRLCHYLIPLLRGFKILRTGFERQFHQLIFVGSLARDNNLPFTLEEPGHRTSGGDTPAAFSDDAADFRRGAIAIVRADFYQQRDAVGPVNFI